VTAYQTALDLNPTSPEFRYNLGLALIELEKYPEARVQFGRALDLQENELRYRLSIGESYRRERDYLRAREAFERALGFGAAVPATYNALGNLNLQENRHAEALACFEGALRLREDDVEAQLGRSAALSGLERHDEAIEAARAVVARLPNLPFGYSALGGAYEAKKEHLLAIPQYEKALQIDPSDAYSWGNLGWTLYGAEKYERAVQVSRKALELDGKLAYVRFNLGLILAVQDSWGEAQKEYREAFKVAGLSDLRAGIKDVKEALKRHETGALKQAVGFLQNEERRMLGIL
jgi:superkiller protein 3